MKIGVACDHAGFEYKEKLKELLSSKGNEINDYGCYSLESVDYPDFAHKLAESIEKGENNFISRGLPLGSNIGSDGDRVQLGFRVVTPYRIITKLEIGHKKIRYDT